MNGAVRQAALALFTIGHTALEGAVMPADDVLLLVQALTMPTKLHEVSAALSPHITPRCACRCLSMAQRLSDSLQGSVSVTLCSEHE